MTRLLIAYDGSPSARTAIAAAGALFEHAEAVVAHVHPPTPSLEASGLARAALPDDVIREGIARMHDDAQTRGRKQVEEGVELARAAGLEARAELRFAATPWRELQAVAAETDADVIVCGTRGDGAIGRVVIGSTASSLLHHADRGLLVVPEGEPDLAGPVLAGFDGSDGARAALRFAADHLRSRPLVVTHAWRSPATGLGALEGYAQSIDLAWSSVAMEMAEDGATFAREAGFEEARTYAPVSGQGTWQTLLAAGQEQGAAAILIGSRGRGALASTVLGSVASGLVHAAEMPVLVARE